MGLVDTHCHLQSKRFHDDQEAAITASLERLDWLVVIGDDVPSSEAGLKLVREQVYAVVGVHPYYAKDRDDARLARGRTLAGEPGSRG